MKGPVHVKSARHRPFSGAVRSVLCLALVLALSGPLATAALAAGGQTASLTGTVVDVSGKPITARATLASPGGTFVQTTDAHGFFNFLDVPIDTYTFTVEAPGFRAYVQTGFTLQGGNTLALGKVVLQRELRTIGRVAARSPASAFTPNQTVPQFTITGSQLQDAQGKAASSNLDQTLLAVPGFQRDSMGSLVLQGSLIDQIRYNVDGVDFSDPAFGFSVNNEFQNGVRAIQVVPGAGDPSQGNSGAGVVNLIVQRGTYPPSGLIDAEADTRPFSHQLNLSYGISTPDGRFSDYFSFLGERNADVYGPWGASAFETNEANAGVFAFEARNDFVNNFVMRFGRNNSQSFQVLYLEHADTDYGNYAGLPLYFPSDAPDFLQLLVGPYSTSGFKDNAAGIAEMQSIMGFEQGQHSSDQPLPENPIVNSAQGQMLKFEYDDAFNASTNLALRFFHSTSWADSSANGPTVVAPFAVTSTEGTSGGTRTGTNFELDRQFGEKNTLTLSGAYSFNRPDFSSLAPYMGFMDLGPDVIDFLRPPDPNLPVGPYNPCPSITSVIKAYDLPKDTQGCYLQQFFWQTGGTPRVPPLDLRFSGIQDQYGMGIRDQFQANERLRFDLGVRYDLINEGFGNNLYYADENIQPVPGSPLTPYVADWPFIETPHFIEPRTGISFRLTQHDSAGFTYGRSIIQSGSGALASPESDQAYVPYNNIPVNPAFVPTGNPYTGVDYVGPNNCYPEVPFPAGAGPGTPPSYKGSVGSTLQLGKPCGSYGEMLYGVNDAFFPEISGVQPGVYDNYDFNFSHEFRNGSAIKINPYYRRGYDVTAITAPLIFIPASGTYQAGTLTNRSVGSSYTSGIDVQYTLPERPYGFTGFVSLSYVNEFTNTPPANDNPYGQDFEPIILPQSLATGALYRAGFLSPFTTQIGISYKSRGGIRVNPVLTFNVGYPIGSGLLTPIFYGKGATFVPNTNITDQFGPGGAPQFVDPANPGSMFDPIVSATRGTPETASGGGELSRPQLFGDVTFEYSPPHTRSTFGLQILNIFNNEYFGLPLVNGNWYPVSSGVAGPLTGQSQTGAAAPTLAPLISHDVYPFGPYEIPINTFYTTPTTFRLYFQYAI